ncbi:MAG: Phosphate-selective porin, partial [Methylobacterium brachiatum]|nr:Phosphate-selective porin [Methylobacterium brachiatum]
LIANVIHGRVQPGAAQSDALGTAPFSVDTILGRLQIYW